MTESLPATAVFRVALVNLDPARFAEVDALNTRQAEYLIPAIKGLPGLIHWYTGVSQDGSMVRISVWDSEEHAVQIDKLKELVVVARGEVEELLGTFTGRVVTYPMSWTI
jgi:hypothetical protein